jgi:MFS family permease
MRNEGHEAMTSAVEADRGRAQTRERRRSTRLILVMRGLRSLAYGLLAVILGVVLADEGFSPVAIGVLITISLLGDMAGTYVIGLLADTWGRRRTLALLALLMAGTGVVFGLVTSSRATPRGLLRDAWHFCLGDRVPVTQDHRTQWV